MTNLITKNPSPIPKPTPLYFEYLHSVKFPKINKLIYQYFLDKKRNYIISHDIPEIAGVC